ncbi:hypothetical protein EV361DRAFT_980736 [Lentinula raphanica]|nr:hypothetical protein EV361DRAFT_980736 [Lentinula raphanica]
MKPDSQSSGPPGLSTHNMEFELVEMPEDTEDIFELSVNSVDWYQDVEDTYYSDSQSGGSDAGSVYSRSDSYDSYRGQGNFDWNSEVESTSSDGSSMGVSEDEESFKGEPMDVDDKCPRCNGWESECSCSETSNANSVDIENPSMNSSDPEWACSVENFLEIRELYASSVIKHLRDSEGSSSVFAWPKETHRWDADATFARGLHNEMNTEHFGFEDDPMQRRFGDPLAEHLEFLLYTSTPFPGESVNDDEITSPDRFVAYRISETQHVLIDSAYDSTDFILPSAHLANPDFEPLEWFMGQLREHYGHTSGFTMLPHRTMGDPRARRVIQILSQGATYPGDDLPEFHPKREKFLGRSTRFNCFLSGVSADAYVVEDRMFGLRWPLPTSLLDDPRFDVYRWLCKWLVSVLRCCLHGDMWETRSMLGNLFDLPNVSHPASGIELALNGVQIPAGQYAGLQRNAARVKDPGRRIARPLVIVVRINGHPVTALLDSGSLCTLMSTTLVDQLKFKEELLASPLTLQLAVQGSRSKINRKVTARFQYQSIDEEREFDVANINYLIILGTDWMFEHSVTLGFNDARVVVGSNTRLPLTSGKSLWLQSNFKLTQV